MGNTRSQAACFLNLALRRRPVKASRERGLAKIHPSGNTRAMDAHLYSTYADPSVHEAVSVLIRRHSTHMTDVRQATLGDLEFGGDAEILDLGCGFGFLAEEIARRCGPRTLITGVDACAANRDTYLRRSGASGCRARFIRSELSRELPFGTARFDKVMCSYSLYFFPELIPEIARVLRPEGLFWILTHSEISFAGIFRATGIESRGNPLVDLVRRFSIENGADLLNPHFGEVELSPYRNVLMFYREDLGDFLDYLRFKLPLIDPRFAPGDPLPKGMADGCRSFLDIYGRIVIEKDDGVFLCRRPR